MTEVHFQLQPSPGSTEEASRWIHQCLLPFAPKVPGRVLSATALARRLGQARLGRMPGRPNAATHRLVLRDVPHAQFASAEVTLHVGSEVASVIRMVGMRPLPEVQDGFAQVAASRAVTSGWAGDPSATVRGLNQLSFRREAPSGTLPAGAACIPGPHGVLLMACSSAVAAESVRASVEALAGAFSRARPADFVGIRAEESWVGAAAHVEAAAPAAASPALPDRVLLMVNPDETVPIPARLHVGPALPFGGTTGDETLQALFARPSPVHDQSGDTVALPVPGSLLQLNVLSFEQYVELRALLTVFGVEHEPTWARFGLTDKSARQLVQLRFAREFSTDNALRDRFLLAVHAQVIALRESAGNQ